MASAAAPPAAVSVEDEQPAQQPASASSAASTGTHKAHGSSNGSGGGGRGASRGGRSTDSASTGSRSNSHSNSNSGAGTGAGTGDAATSATTTDASRNSASNATATANGILPLRNKHCHFVLLAEFDIDRGSTLSHQYPGPIGHDDHILAELMLPDGAHARSEDWTVFFLKQTSPRSRPRQSSVNGEANGKATADEGESSKAGGAAGTRPGTAGSGASTDSDIVYVLNLVRTKHDNTVRRGAMVKSMSIGTSHPFIQIFKPALLLALDDYFANPGIDCLARLYDAINNMDLAGMPTFSVNEKLILRASERRDLFEERFAAAARKDDKEPVAPRDTHFFDTSITFRQVPIPIRLPLTTFPEEVGEYSLLKFIQTFANSTPVGPQHPHLHSNGALTHPIVLIFNAMATQKRVIFLGHGQPANDVATFVLSACALGSGCGSVFRGFTARAFPYANLTSLDEMEKVPGYIAGVTNPRFEDLPAWDVICNIETGKITVSKDIEPAPPYGTHSAHSHAHSRQGLAKDHFSSGSLSYASGSLSNINALHAAALAAGAGGGIGTGAGAGGGSASNAGTVSSMAGVLGSSSNGGGGGGTGDGTLQTSHNSGSSSRAPSEVDAQSISGGYSAMSSVGGGAISGGMGTLSRTGTTLSSGKEKPIHIEGRPDALDNVLIEDLISAIQSRFGEAYVRARVVDYAALFGRIVSRHEEHFWGHTKTGWPSQPFLNGQLGSGLVYADREMEMREISVNAMRAEGWRASSAYPLFRQDAIHREVTREIRTFDVLHQIQRLRRAKQLSAGESDLIFASIARAVRTPQQIIELLSYLPAHNGGLAPLAYGLYHPVPSVRNAMVDFFANLCGHPVARKFVAGLSTFHRLALARLLHEREVAQANAGTVRAAQAQNGGLTMDGLHGGAGGGGPGGPGGTMRARAESAAPYPGSLSAASPPMSAPPSVPPPPLPGQVPVQPTSLGAAAASVAAMASPAPGSSKSGHRGNAPSVASVASAGAGATPPMPPPASTLPPPSTSIATHAPPVPVQSSATSALASKARSPSVSSHASAAPVTTSASRLVVRNRASSSVSTQGSGGSRTGPPPGEGVSAAAAAAAAAASGASSSQHQGPGAVPPLPRHSQHLHQLGVPLPTGPGSTAASSAATSPALSRVPSSTASTSAA